MNPVFEQPTIQGLVWPISVHGDARNPPVVVIPGLEDSFLGQGLVGHLAAGGIFDKLFYQLLRSQPTFQSELCSRFHVTVVSRPRGIPPGTTMQDMAAWYAAFIRERFGRAPAIGLSMGGFIVQVLGTRHADVVTKVVPTITAPRIEGEGRALVEGWRELAYDEQWLEFMRRLSDDSFATASGRFFGKSAAGMMSAMIKRAIHGGLMHARDPFVSLEACMAFDEWNSAGNLRVPAMVVAGELDAIFAREQTERFAKSLGGGVPYAVAPRAGHIITERKPDFRRVVDRVAEFLKG